MNSSKEDNRFRTTQGGAWDTTLVADATTMRREFVKPSRRVFDNLGFRATLAGRTPRV